MTPSEYTVNSDLRDIDEAQDLQTIGDTFIMQENPVNRVEDQPTIETASVGNTHTTTELSGKAVEITSSHQPTIGMPTRQKGSYGNYSS